jgi:protein gp37
MGETTKIEWCDATVNFWHGCTKVSPACANCYALTLSKRWGKDIWGPGKPREDHRAGAAKLARKLERQAVAEGRRLRVFCASMADWLDDEVPADWLADLLCLVAETPHLDWLLLSKRPHLWRERLDAALDACGLASQCRCQERCFCDARTVARLWLDGDPPPNVWAGATVEDQERADERIPALLAIPARVRFLSMEPLLGPVDVRRYLWPTHWHWDAKFNTPEEALAAGASAERKRQGIVSADARFVDWIIAGGESGSGARPSHPDWFRSLRDQAAAAGVAFHFKQWGEYAPEGEGPGPDPAWVDLDGKVTADRCPVPPAPGAVAMQRIGKARAGRLLDGREWSELPEVARG